MSKSLGNCIYLSDTSKEIKKKVNSMYTDPEHLQITDPGHVEGNVVFTYLDAFSTPEHFAKFLPEYANLDEMKEHYRRGGLGDGTCKKFLFNIMEEFLAPIRERRKAYEQDIPKVYEILRKGCEVARAEAAKTLEEVRAAMKINYFEDAELIAEHTRKYMK
jgi:tryptophanyl-tRNA synthetase